MVGFLDMTPAELAEVPTAADGSAVRLSIWCKPSTRCVSAA